MNRELALKLVRDEKLLKGIISFNLSARTAKAEELAAARRAAIDNWYAALPEVQQKLYQELQRNWPALRLFSRPPFAAEEKLPGVSSAQEEQVEQWSYFADPAERLALLDDKALTKLCLLTGAARLAPFLRSLLGREQQAQARQSLGAGVIDFALHFGAFALPPALQRSHLESSAESGSLADLRQQALMLGTNALQLLAADFADRRVQAVLTERLGKIGAGAAAAAAPGSAAMPEVHKQGLRRFVLAVMQEVSLSE